MRRFFGWCIERRLLQNNPAAVIRKPSKEESRTRVLSDEELQEVWSASDCLGSPFGPFVKGLILTGQRRNELAGARWAEINLDTQEWIIPPARTKNGKEHIVSLSDAMVRILTNLPRFSAEELADGLVFTTTGTTCVSGFSRAKSKLDIEIQHRRAEVAAASGRNSAKAKQLPVWTFHDLRRSCATGMGRLGIPPHIIEAVLNHSSGFRAGIAGVYQRHPYLEERRHALDSWGSHILRLKGTQGEGNVVVFTRTAS